ANLDLTWEKSGQWDIGLDVAFWDSRMRLVFDYYRKNTQDLLFTINLPAYSGFSTALFNTGSLLNKGFEIELDFDILSGNVTWSAQANYSRNKTAMTSLGRSGATNLFIGYPPGVGLAYVFDGVFRNQGEIDQQTAQVGVVPGDYKYKDID